MHPEHKKNVRHRLQDLILEVMRTLPQFLRSKIYVLGCQGVPPRTPSKLRTFWIRHCQSKREGGEVRARSEFRGADPGEIQAIRRTR